MIALADEFDISKFSVHNSEEDGKQIVIAKADAVDAQLRAFIDAVRARKSKKADVSGIRSEPFEGRVSSIVRSKLDQMLDKQDETTAEIRDLRDDLVHHSNTERLSRMEKDIRLIKSKIGIRPR